MMNKITMLSECLSVPATVDAAICPPDYDCCYTMRLIIRKEQIKIAYVQPLILNFLLSVVRYPMLALDQAFRLQSLEAVWSAVRGYRRVPPDSSTWFVSLLEKIDSNLCEL